MALTQIPTRLLDIASMGPQLDSCGWGAVRRWRKSMLALQWGRNLTVADGMWTKSTRQSESWLQWGRNLTVADGAASIASFDDAYVLQWGRNLTVADGARVRATFHVGRTASMGPQLDSCGWRHV